MNPFSPYQDGIGACISKAIDDVFVRATTSGVTVIDVRTEAERIRSTVAGAAVMSTDDLIRMIGSEGVRLGIGLEFR
jgi:hypothetical protein